MSVSEIESTFSVPSAAINGCSGAPGLTRQRRGSDRFAVALARRLCQNPSYASQATRANGPFKPPVRSSISRFEDVD
jgi:hypothetical protein